MNNIKERLNKLRTLMNQYNIDCIIVPTNDYHSSEYVADYFKEREFITGFTGSAGTAVILKEDAGLWTDGRYFLQAEQELEGSGITLYKQGLITTPSISDYINMQEDIKTISFNAKLMNTSSALELIDKLKDRNFNYVLDKDLVNDIWYSRSNQLFNEVYNYPVSYAGEEYTNKLNKVTNHLKETNSNGLILSSLDDIAWLFNLRGSDVHCNPVFQSYATIINNVVTLYLNVDSFNLLTKVICKKNGIILKDYNQIYEDLKELTGLTITVDFNKINYQIYNLLLKNNKLINELNYTSVLKAIKNDVEIANAYKYHILDGASLTTFIYNTKKNAVKEHDTELSLVKKLYDLRKDNEGFKDISFDTIAGYKEHGAIVHYDPSEETNVLVKGESFLLVDSGAQYLGSTTDVTRTIALGQLTEEEKKVYTLVLKAHLALGNACFKEGTTGKELDDLTRGVLQKYNYDYKHGTGHGVGSFLNVHEGPQSISLRATNQYPFSEGMITSNEPGVYLEGKFGVRIENLILCVKDNDMLKFDTLTIAPYEIDAIDKKYLTDEEISLIHNYHVRVYEILKDKVSKEVSEWLLSICNSL